MAFAFEVDVGIVDTNSGRVLSRAVAGRRITAGEAQRLVDAMVPEGKGWPFGQALLDLGATVCAAEAPRCDHCPIRRRCRWAVSGRVTADPAAGSAGSSPVQARFDGSDRQGRGRLVDRLREGPVAPGGIAPAAGWPDDPERARRVAAELVEEGLVVRDATGVLRLP